MLNEGWPVGADDDVVALDAEGAELGRTRLGVSSEVDGLLAPPSR